MEGITYPFKSVSLIPQCEGRIFVGEEKYVNGPEKSYVMTFRIREFRLLQYFRTPFPAFLNERDE